MKVRRDKSDILYSLLVRERAGWACERCNARFSEHQRGGLECSHFYTRSRRSVRVHPLNSAAHCTGCHTWLGGNPLEFGKWIEAHLGTKKTLHLQTLSRQLVNLKKHDKADIHANLKASWEDMQARRKAGEAGRLEFEDPMPDDVWARAV